MSDLEKLLYPMLLNRVEPLTPFQFIDALHVAGFKIIAREPTEAMNDAGLELQYGVPVELFRAMWDAAPTQPQGGDEAIDWKDRYEAERQAHEATISHYEKRDES